MGVYDYSYDGELQRKDKDNIRLMRENRDLMDLLQTAKQKIQKKNEYIQELEERIQQLEIKYKQKKNNAYKVGIAYSDLKVYLENGMSIRAIAKQFNVSPNTIRNRIAEYHLEEVIRA